ncbi:MAG: DUF262 domain-containing protein [Pseudonocardiaceae bacterium]
MADGVVFPEPVAQELDSLGQATGVETEADDSALAEDINNPFDPEKIDVVTRTLAVDYLLSRIRTQLMDLQPDFQRRAGIWTNKAKSRLIESLLLRIPIPTLYAVETEDGSWSIVDGVQRLAAIAEFVEPVVIGAQPLQLTDLEYLDKCEGMFFDDLPGRLQARLREAELVVHLLRRGTPEAVKFNIFSRLNTRGLRLSAQELRHALIPGKARRYLKEWAESSAFLDATGRSIRGDRMADREMVLRFVAFRLTEPESYVSQDFDEFLRDAMKALNRFSPAEVDRLEHDFTIAMVTARDTFGMHAFRKRNPGGGGGRFPVNKALFEAVSVNLAALSEQQRQCLLERKDKIDEKFMGLMGDVDFQIAISQGTGDVAKVKRRFRRIQELFAEVIA